MDMRIEPFISTYRHGNRYRPEVIEGTELYAIAYAEGGYFTFCYVRRSDAEAVMANMARYPEKQQRAAYSFNKRDDIHQTITTGILRSDRLK